MQSKKTVVVRGRRHRIIRGRPKQKNTAYHHKPRMQRATADDDAPWPEEEEAIKNIKEGIVKTETVSADKLLAELKALEDE